MNLWLADISCIWFLFLFNFTHFYKGIEYYLDHRGSYFYIITNNDNAYNYKLENVHENDLFDPSKWKVIVEHDEEIKIEDIDLFEV